MGKKRKQEKDNKPGLNDKVEDQQVPSVRSSDEPVKKKVKWTNKERVLLFSSRGISYRDRHLMLDFRTMMPHSKTETKMDRKDKLFIINEMCEMKNCRKCVYFEARKKKDLYMWVSNVPNGPSAKFLTENVHTMNELKMTGNCLKGTRPLLAFDKNFDSEPRWALIKELFTQTFGTPNYHPKSQPFFDHVFSFSIADNRIWFRNYQILEENGELAEIGPRMVLNPIRIFKGSFGGPTLYLNPDYVSPNVRRREIRQKKGVKYQEKLSAQKAYDKRLKQRTNIVPKHVADDVFRTH